MHRDNVRGILDALLQRDAAPSTAYLSSFLKRNVIIPGVDRMTLQLSPLLDIQTGIC